MSTAATPTRSATASPARYDAGTWTSPVVELDYPDDEAISSWNATTPTGTWVETLVPRPAPRRDVDKWYVMGRWTSGRDYADGDIHRTSVDGQRRHRRPGSSPTPSATR